MLVEPILREREQIQHCSDCDLYSKWKQFEYILAKKKQIDKIYTFFFCAKSITKAIFNKKNRFKFLINKNKVINKATKKCFEKIQNIYQGK